MSKGPIALIGWLFIAAAILISIVSLLVVTFCVGPEGKGTFWEVAWASLMRTLDAGTMGGDEGHWSFLLAMLVVTFGGIFIVSDSLLSLMLSQISENAELAAVFQSLFESEGSEIYLKPVEDYVQTGKPLNFYTVVEAARRRNEVAIGYRLQDQSQNVEKSYGVKLNPEKSLQVSYGKEDRIIVLADN